MMMISTITQKWNAHFFTEFLGLALACGRNEPATDAEGVRRWYQDGQLHQEDGPAVEYPDGTFYWYRYGRKHRDDGPAVSYACGQKEWHVNGELRCLETANGSRYWYRNGRLHRDDGPAVDEVGGRRVWYRNGCPVHDRIS